MVRVVALLSSLLLFACAPEAEDRKLTKKSDVSSVETVEQDDNKPAEKAESADAEPAKANEPIVDFFFSDDLSLLKEILGLGKDGDVSGILGKIDGLDEVASMAFFNSLKGDIAECLDIYADFKSHEGLFFMKLRELGLTSLTVDSILTLDLNKLRDDLIAKSPDFLAIALSKKDDFGKCVESVKEVAASKEVLDLKSIFEGKLTSAVSGYSDVMLLDCKNEREGLTESCSEVLDFACNIKSLLINDGNWATAAIKLATLDFTQIDQCLAP